MAARSTPDLRGGACRGSGDDMFPPSETSGPYLRAAKRRCVGCPVQPDCLAYALATGDRYGIWGGLTFAERRAVADGLPVRTCGRCGVLFARRGRYCRPCVMAINRVRADRELAECGTLGAYARHRRAGESPCDQCREAFNRAAVARRAGREVAA